MSNSNYSSNLKDLYAKLSTDSGLKELEDNVGEKEKVVNAINAFLDKYPNIIPKDKIPSTPIFELSVKEIYRRTLQTIIDIINEVSNIISQRIYMSQTEFRRKLFETFTNSDRRLYVGILLIILSFIIYFIDSAA
jgi:hypothetical protein